MGNTPLVHLRRYLEPPGLRLYAKLEMANPGGSAKDRPARRMLDEARRAGRIGPRTLVVESSSGNTGIGLAQYCRYHGLRFRCVVDPRAQAGNLALLRAYGAEIDLVRDPDPATGDFLAARWQRVEEILRTEPDSFWPNQYFNRDNPRSHQAGTMREIDEALGGEIDYLFVAVSSTGTAQGCADYLRDRGRDTRVVAVDAEGSVLFGGRRSSRHIPGMGAGITPPLALRTRVDEVVRMRDLDCVVGCRRLVEREAILAGGSSGGVLEAVRRLAPSLPPNATCVALLADRGSRYLDTVYNDAWVESTLGCSPQDLAQRVAGNETMDPGATEAGEAEETALARVASG